jgi:uncharacterized protein YbjT (DUF2867 family)
MRTRRIAVLGGSGFIGRYVVKRLAAQGAVVAVGCRHAEEAKFLQPMGNVGQIAVVDLSIGDEALLPAFLAGNDALINCVGILYERGAQRFDLVHHSGPARLARLAREAGIERFVHLSALGADSRSPSAYARSKAEGEQAVRDAFPTATILRPSVVFGPEDQFFNRLAAMAMISPVLPLIGGGHARFQPVYVGDVAEAAVRCLTEPVAAGRIYELGGPKIYTLRELVELLLAEIRRRRLLVDLPFGLAELQARFLSMLPKPPLTPDQVELLKRDNVVSAGAMTLETLGITPTALEMILPTYLDRFRRGGWYERPRS